MINVRVALFATTLLGFMYGVLSLTNATKTDTLVGLAVALIGVVGWITCNVIEEMR